MRQGGGNQENGLLTAGLPGKHGKAWESVKWDSNFSWSLLRAENKYKKGKHFEGTREIAITMVSPQIKWWPPSGPLGQCPASQAMPTGLPKFLQVALSLDADKSNQGAFLLGENARSHFPMDVALLAKKELDSSEENGSIGGTIVSGRQLTKNPQIKSHEV